MAGKKVPEGLERSFLLFGGKEETLRRMKRNEMGGDEGLVDIFNNFTYRGLDARNVLDPKSQQLCGIAALTALNAPGPLKTHIKIALRVGVTKAEVIEAIVQTARYCGLPYMQSSLAVLRDVVAESKGGGKTK